MAGAGSRAAKRGRGGKGKKGKPKKVVAFSRDVFKETARKLEATREKRNADAWRRFKGQ